MPIGTAEPWFTLILLRQLSRTLVDGGKSVLPLKPRSGLPLNVPSFRIQSQLPKKSPIFPTGYKWKERWFECGFVTGGKKRSGSILRLSCRFHHNRRPVRKRLILLNREEAILPLHLLKTRISRRNAQMIVIRKLAKLLICLVCPSFW